MVTALNKKTWAVCTQEHLLAVKKSFHQSPRHLDNLVAKVYVPVKMATLNFTKQTRNPVPLQFVSLISVVYHLPRFFVFKMWAFTCRHVNAFCRTLYIQQNRWLEQMITFILAISITERVEVSSQFQNHGQYKIDFSFLLN